MAFTGTFKLVSFDNADAYLLEFGVPANAIDDIKKSTSTTEISQNGDNWTLKMANSFGEVSNTFQLGREFDEKLQSGRNVKTVVTQDGNKWTKVQKREKEITSVMEFTEAGITITHTLNGVSCVRVFERQ
ncbi:Fatty acid-binding protein, heart [Halotydeus destructor]|nr:Fatty acid-binding protein, heart [Halotydeus destructor]